MHAVHYIGNRTFTVGPGTAVPPGPNEVRLDVAYAGICGTDLHIFHGAMDRRVQTPCVIGHEMAGTIAEVGPGVAGLAVGDNVVVRPLDTRGETPADRGHSHICRQLKFMGIDSPGAFQSSWTVPAFAVHKLPAAVDLQTGALAEPLAVACHDVRLGAVRAGELAVVIGGGPIGLLVALVARQAGASVLVTEVGAFRLELSRSLGFEAWDPTSVDLPAYVREISGGSGADIVFEVSGARSAVLGMTDLLAIRGRIVLVAIHPQPVEVNLFQFFWKELRLAGARVYEREDYEAAIALMASGKLPLARLITSVRPLTELPAVMEALERDPRAVKVLLNCQR
jgi:2-desacetyl-2-hydroxyethyl bacteriochlorophyllide A dehydrogenase